MALPAGTCPITTMSAVICRAEETSPPASWTLKRSARASSPREKAVYPGLRQVFWKPQREKAGQRLAAHGGNVAQATRQATVAHDGGGVPGAAKMHVLNAKVGGDQQFESRVQAKDGAVVANALYYGSVRQRCRRPAGYARSGFFL